jgi:hypothetical protein
MIQGVNMTLNELRNIPEADLVEILKAHNAVINHVLRTLGFSSKNATHTRGYLNEVIERYPELKTLKAKSRLRLDRYNNLETAVQESFGWSEVMVKLNLTLHSDNYKVAQRLAKQRGLDTDHFSLSKVQRLAKGSPLEAHFVIGSPGHRKTNIKKLVTDNKLLEPYQCSVCQNPGVHLNKPLLLELDHINGQCHDNRLENLRWVCPNCHAQTETHKYKNRKWSEKT